MRIRLSWSICNGWSVIHTILFLLQFVIDLLYIWARPQQTLSFIETLSENQTFKIGSFVETLQKSCPEKIYDFFNPPDDYSTKCKETQCKIYEVGMWFASYSFLLEALVELLFNSVACSMFGETEHTILLGCTQKGEFRAVEMTKTKSDKKQNKTEQIIPATINL